MARNYYFNNLPDITFQDQRLNDLFFHFDINDRFYQSDYYIPYTIQPGVERPDQISVEVYETPRLWWLICLYNNRLDPFHDFPLGVQELEQLAIKKAEYLYGVYTTLQLSSVLDDLFTENETKRNLRIPVASTVQQILSNFHQFFAGIV